MSHVVDHGEHGEGDPPFLEKGGFRGPRHPHHIGMVGQEANLGPGLEAGAPGLDIDSPLPHGPNSGPGHPAQLSSQMGIQFGNDVQSLLVGEGGGRMEAEVVLGNHGAAQGQFTVQGTHREQPHGPSHTELLQGQSMGVVGNPVRRQLLARSVAGEEGEAVSDPHAHLPAGSPDPAGFSRQVRGRPEEAAAPQDSEPAPSRRSQTALLHQAFLRHSAASNWIESPVVGSLTHHTHHTRAKPSGLGPGTRLPPTLLPSSWMRGEKMRSGDTEHRSIWLESDGWSVGIIDQTRLPEAFETSRLTTLEETAAAISRMQVRGAPLIGVTAAYGLALSLRRDPGDEALDTARRTLLATRPTAVNLRWAVDRVTAVTLPLPPEERARAAYGEAARLAEADVEVNRRIGEEGLTLLRNAASNGGEGPVQVLTHCNAGRLATVDLGTATAPLYLAHEEGVELHVWVSETRPRNQGAALTAWELGRAGIAHTVLVDSAGSYLMAQGRVDLCIVGADRVAANGDVANKIGTYPKALAARDNGVPIYVAAPLSTIDRTLADGGAIPIEERNPDEVTHVRGRTADGEVALVELTPPGTRAANPALDLTPARLVTGLITQEGLVPASPAGLNSLPWSRATVRSRRA